MFLIVGLGNPGAEYDGTRHNAGFMVADAIADAYHFSAFKSKFDGLIAEGMIDGEKCLLLKPQTYMNLSGNSVIKAASFYKILPAQIIVIHDDMDLQSNQIKAKIGGGAGGHNGLKSIDSHIGNGYNRIRLGVGHPKGVGEDVVNHVLSRFSKADAELLQHRIEIIIKYLPILLKKGVADFSNKIGMEKIS
ncbi:MAG: aminoacyl-tRNA hydrolase [Alphaproteobacteria bacterium]|nr:aminoacyl-tRNA hydrolase [Alphaproteobacteria bacterium]